MTETGVAEWLQIFLSSAKKMLTNRTLPATIINSGCEKQLRAAVAQSVERRIGSAEVTGPIPVSSFEKP